MPLQNQVASFLTLRVRNASGIMPDVAAFIRDRRNPLSQRIDDSARVLRDVALVPRRPACSPALREPVDIGNRTRHGRAQLRKIARQVARRSPSRTDVILIGTDGGAMALNLLLNLQRLAYAHIMVMGAPGRDACASVSGAVERLPADVHGRDDLRCMACVWDGWWEAFLADEHRGLDVDARIVSWLARAGAMARLMRLGYSVLRLDDDLVILSDVYPILQSRFCSSFTLAFASEAMRGSGLQAGAMFACGGRRDGAGAWVAHELLDRFYRVGALTLTLTLTLP